MLKCITFDGDTSTLNTLMGYFEKLDKALADVHQVLSKEQTERPIFVREGSKNRFGERLLETWQRSGADSRVRKYLLDWRNKLTAQGRDASPVNELLTKLMA